MSRQYYPRLTGSIGKGCSNGSITISESGFKHGFKEPKRGVWRSRKWTARQIEAEQEREYRRKSLKRCVGQAVDKVDTTTAYEKPSEYSKFVKAMKGVGLADDAIADLWKVHPANPEVIAAAAAKASAKPADAPVSLS